MPTTKHARVARPSPAIQAKRRIVEHRDSLVEPLESRTLFGGSPFPTIGSLENPNDTVVRMNTQYGDIDIELFDSVTPITVNNFLNYVRDGDYDQTFFHRLATNFVLQGGGFRYDGLPGQTPTFSAVPQDAQIMNEFNRSNVERTIAMAKLAAPQDGGPPNGGPNSATNQWFFNLSDNSGNLDSQNGGFTVFGRVLGDASWAVVQTIAGLTVRNLSSTAPFNDPQFAGNFSTTPVTVSGTPGQNPPEDTVVRIRDIEIIKARNVQAFYTDSFFYPEGFAGSTISEFLPIGNPTNATVFYQVIARSEVTSGDISTTAGWFRDRVISTGSVPAHSRGGITISQFGPGGAPGMNDLLPQGVPYSIEIRSTGQLAATLSHYDFGTSTGEAFTTSLDSTWGFAQAQKLNGSVFDFLVWSNPNPTAANIAITFYFQSSPSVTVNVTTDAFRRGGFAFQNVAQIPDNTVFSARMVSDVPIVAALSHFDNRGDQTGSTQLGTPGNGSEVGILPGAVGGPGVTQTISFLNPNNTAAVISMILRFENPAQEVSVPITILSANRRTQINLATNANARVQAGEPFSVRYSVSPSGLAIYADSAVTAFTDVASTPVAIVAATNWNFGEGFMDPARASVNVFETISLYNPNSVFFTGMNTTANVTINFLYTDGFVLTQNATISGGGRFEMNVDENQAVLDQGTMNNRFFYSVQVISDVPIIAQMFHYDLTLGGLQASGGFTTSGTPSGTITRLDQL
ncbi:MAG: peptidylprolyl isomerase [Phycisphaerales bacterium]